jgi:hypothetical protein
MRALPKMGTLNQALGMNLTEDQPLIDSPFNESASISYIVPPPGSEYMITETGLFMQTESSLNLMITE